MSPEGRRFLTGLILLALVLAGLPFTVTNPYYLNVLNVVALHVIIASGLNLLIGYAGHISLGHAAFFGLGAYLSGILTGTHGWSPWPTLVLAAGVVAE